ncbi:MAG TPA: MMPL family transporter [Gaiellaceae bacterium]|nr:MMPL family transporter [Gaiellaceae bacterium]
MNIAGRMGRWSAAHWKTATVGWLALVAIALVAGQTVGTRSLTTAEQAQAGSARAERILARAGFEPPASEGVLVQSTVARPGRPLFAAAVRDLRRALRQMPQVARVTGTAVSKDGRSELVTFDVAGKADSADQRIQPVLDRVAAVQHAHPGFMLQEVGDASANRAANTVIEQDLKSAEVTSVPVTFAILLFAFGAFVAAGLPVLLALSAVLATVGLGAVVSHVIHASNTTSSVVVLMGMAVGVDYSLFYLRREREERARGREPREALHAAAATSGRAVLVSGLTVAVACAGMMLSGSGDFVSMGFGAILVVLVAMIGSLTVLPALLGRLGDRVDWGSLRWLKRGNGESRLWNLVLRPALRFPLVAALVATAGLVVVALPAFDMRTANPSFDSFPKNLPIVKAFHAVNRAFPGTPSPAEVVVSAPDVTAPAVRRGIGELRRRALATGRMHAPIRETVNAAHTVARIEIPLAGNGDDAASVAALETLRSRVIPATIGAVPGVEAPVTGQTADSYDFRHTMDARMPYVFGFVLLVAFGLLLATFRSIVVPLTAVALNMLSVGAAYGALVWIFQDGHLHGLLGFQPTGAIVTWMPLFLFTVLFGLSMDYHVFIVSRIRELVLGGRTTREAVAQGIRTTASTVTSAAAVMIAVFAIFAFTRTIFMKELGVGLAVAVLVDATVIRGVLLPAVMTVLGERNWYLPRVLARMPEPAAEV